MEKKLFPLVGIFCLLLVVAVGKKISTRATDNLVEQSGAVKLVPEGFLASDVTKVEIFRGDTTEEKVVLEKKDKTWTIATAFQAEADETKIDNFLEELKKHYGEVRPTSKDSWKDYALDDKSALHVKIYRGDKETHLLIGKRINWKASFVRLGNTEQVLYVGKELRGELDVHGETDKPESKNWIKKEILKLNSADIQKLTLVYPDKKIDFEKVKIVAESESDEIPADIEEPRYEWQAKGIDLELKKDEVKSLLSSISTVEIQNVFAASKRGELGLDKPNFQATITLADGKTHHIYVASPRANDDSYLSLGSEENDLVYELAATEMMNIFRRGSELFKLPKVRIKKDDVAEIILNRKEGTILFKKVGDRWGWNVNIPGANLNNGPIDSLLKRLEEVSFDDVVFDKTKSDLGLDQPKETLQVLTTNGVQYSFKIGYPSVVSDGHYFSLDNNDVLGAISKPHYQELIPRLNELFSIDLAQQNLTQMTFPGVSFTLNGDNWITADGQNLDQSKVNGLALHLKNINVKDIYLHERSLEGREVILEVQFQAGEIRTLKVYEADDENFRFPAVLNDSKVVFWLEDSDVERLQLKPEDYLGEAKEASSEGVSKETEKTEEVSSEGVSEGTDKTEEVSSEGVSEGTDKTEEASKEVEKENVEDSPSVSEEKPIERTEGASDTDAESGEGEASEAEKTELE